MDTPEGGGNYLKVLPALSIGNYSVKEINSSLIMSAIGNNSFPC